MTSSSDTTVTREPDGSVRAPVRFGDIPAVIWVAGRQVDVEVEGRRSGLDPHRVLAALSKRMPEWLPVAAAISATLRGYPHADPYEVVCLARSIATDKAAFVKSQTVDDWQWYLLARDRAQPVRGIIAAQAGSGRVPADVVTLLADDPAQSVRRALASALRHHPDLLLRLARDPEHLVRLRVARNSTTPHEALALLADDPDDQVRQAIAGRDDLHPALIEHLAADPCEHVRAAIAMRRDLPRTLVDTLAADRRATVRQWIAQRRDITDAHIIRLAADKSAAVKIAIAGRLDPIPDAAGDLLIADANVEVRRHMALRDDLTPHQIGILGNDRSSRVRNLIHIRVGQSPDPAKP